MYYYFIFVVAITITETYSDIIDENIAEYFESDEMAEFRIKWDIHRKAMENAIASALQDTMGKDAMNVYIRKNGGKLSRGYYHDDRLVQLILSDLDLEEIPRFYQPDISFSLASNVIKIETLVSKIVVNSDYLLLRNRSDIIYEVQKQNDSRTSPFLFQQVQTMGKIGISIDHCILSGFAIAALSGTSVNLGHDSFKLSKCHFTMEIYNIGLGSPPVIAKYFPIGEVMRLDQLVMQPIYEELIPKLQATIYSFINTTDIFGTEQLAPIRKKQKALFEMTSNYLAKVVRFLNRLTIKNNKDALELEDHTFIWDDTVASHHGNISQLTLTDMVVTGLDTVYSSHTGGPYKISDVDIGDTIRFSSIQVRGHVALINGPGVIHEHDFACEMTDVEVNIVLKVNMNSKKEPTTAKLKKIGLRGIRSMEFSVPGVVFAPLEPILTGYLLSEVSKQLLLHLSQTFEQAIHDATSDFFKDEAIPFSDNSKYSGSAGNEVDETEEESKFNLLKYINSHEVKRTADLRAKAKKTAKPVKKHVNKVKTVKPAVKRTKKVNKSITK